MSSSGLFFTNYFNTFLSYIVEIAPVLGLGFFISGLINEFVPENWVEKHLGRKGIMPLVYSSIVGAISPVCCFGSLPIAISFYKKGASLGAVFTFLMATPATSVSAILVAWKFLGFKMTLYLFINVIIMAIIMGITGNLLKINNKNVLHSAHKESEETCPHCHAAHLNKTIKERVKCVLTYAFIDMPKEIGLETIIGLALAALVSVSTPIGLLIKTYLSTGYSYIFSVLFGLSVYMCATMSIPFVDALMNQGMNTGAGIAMLIIGPVASYGTILVLARKFGIKILVTFLVSLTFLSVIVGYLYK